jgi:uncharacterized protein involved in outer membrane biogenesis
MKILKKILKWIAITLAVLIVALFIFTSFIINHFKYDVEQAFYKRTGMKAQIEGNLQLKIFPGFSLVFNKLSLINNETYFLRAETVELALDFKSYILGQQVLIKSINLTKPQIFIFKGENNQFNFETSFEKEKKPANPIKFNLVDLSISDGSLLYYDKGHEDTLFISGINISTELIKAEGEIEQFQASNNSFSGKMDIGGFQLNAMHVKNIFLKVNASGGKISFLPEKTAFYGGNFSGTSTIDLNSEPVATTINYTAENVKIDSLLMDFDMPWYLRGRIKLETDLHFSSFNWGEAKQSLNGIISLSGEDVVIYGFNTQVVVDNFEKSAKFSAINAAAALMAGPMGAVFTNENSLTPLLTNDSGDSLLAKKFISKWEFREGFAYANDVAFSDGKYRVAVTGKIDFINKSYINFFVSLLNVSGCPVIGQQIKGNFLQPEVIAVSNIDSKMSLNEALTSRENCTSAYTGSISSP